MNELVKIEEPKVLFGYNQKLEDPRDGLTIFGPLENLRPYGIISGVISTKNGLEKFKKFLTEIEGPIYNRDNTSRPFFPGFNSVFKMEWSAKKIYHINIDESELGKCLYHEDVHSRTYQTVSLFADKIIAAKKDEHVDINLWVVIIPDEVYETCRPQSTLKKELVITKKTITKTRAKNLLAEPALWDDMNQAAKPFAFEANFHNQLKARLLKYTLPTQIIRESTLSPGDYLNAFGLPKRDFSKIRVIWHGQYLLLHFIKLVGNPGN